MERKNIICLFTLWMSLTLQQVEGSSSTVQVRLVDNSVPNAGRVEISFKGVWKSVCDSNWYSSAANVVCKMLGYNQGAASVIKGMTSSDDAWLSTISCRGHETTIEQCRIQNRIPTRCAHDRRAGVVCITGQGPNVAVRLVNGRTPNEGRVEVRYYGMWSEVCNAGWDLADAHVVCHMLNYRKASWAGTANVSGNGPVLLSYLPCRGYEASVETCPYIPWGYHYCNTKKHAAVRCDNKKDAPHVSVRLVGNKNNHFEQVEVNYNRTWRPVCDDTWDISDAHVVCRMLGYKGAQAVIKKFSVGKAGLWMSGVACSGKEKSISECFHRGWSNTYCPGNFYAGVVCKVKEAQGPNLAVRLLNGSTPNEGRVEVRYYGVWGTVCDDSWDLADAHVVCRMLNYSKASWTGTAKVKGSGPILLDDVNCRGNEKSLEHCKHIGWGQHNCGHHEDAGVKCEKLTQEESSVAVRLVGSDHNNIGFVEVNYNGTWRPVCDDTWDISDAHVVCRMLGYKAALAGIKQYRLGKGGLWMGGVGCSGDEVSISECSHRGWTNKLCSGNLYAGVMCKGNKDLPPVEVRLEDGSSPNFGHVAVRYGNLWGTICNKGLDINDAEVICRMLGYPGASKVYLLQTLMLEVRPIWLSNLGCNGTEKSIVECRHSGWWNTTTCNHDNDGAIMCKIPDTPQFQINGTNAITESTVVILVNDSQQIDAQLKRIYQVAVEKRDTEQRFKCYEQPPSFVYNEVNVTMATQMGNDSYITAEILGPISNVTIGDGQYYHGYYNAPLEPGSMYRVHVRIVTMAIDRKRVYGDSTSVSFTTKAFNTGQVKNVQSSSPQGVMIGLSLFIVVLIIIMISFLVWYFLRKKKENKKETTTQMSDITATNSNVCAAWNEQQTTSYQSLIFPSKEQHNAPDNLGQVPSIYSTPYQEPKQNVNNRELPEIPVEANTSAERQHPLSQYQGLVFSSSDGDKKMNTRTVPNSGPFHQGGTSTGVKTNPKKSKQHPNVSTKSPNPAYQLENVVYENEI